MTITKDKFTNKILISIDNINNIGFLDVLPIYIDSIIRLTQNIDSTRIPRSRINKLCGSKELQEEAVVEDLESKLEENLQLNKGFEFKGDELEDDELDDDEGLFGLLDEGEDDDELIGGGDSDEESEGYISFEEATPTLSATPTPLSSKKESKSPDSKSFVLEEATPTPSATPTPLSSKNKSVSLENESLELEDATPTPSATPTPLSSKKESKSPDSKSFVLEDATPTPSATPTPLSSKIKVYHLKMNH